MKKLVSLFALFLTLVAVIPAYARFGYEGENPTTNRLGYRNEQQRAQQEKERREKQREEWKKSHQGTRATPTTRKIAY